MNWITVKDVGISYELIGGGGPTVAFQNPIRGRDQFAYFFAGRLSARCRVLLFDPRNIGASDVKFSDDYNPGTDYVEDLHALLHHLNLTPAYVGGFGLAAVYGLLMASRYPRDVKGLLLQAPPTTSPEVRATYAERFYLRLADVAERDGMEAALLESQKTYLNGDHITSWLVLTTTDNRENRDRILSLDPAAFVRAMRHAAGEFTSRIHLGNMTNDEVGQILAPAIVVPGFDAVHPKDSAREVYDLLPNAEWVDYESHFQPAATTRLRVDATGPEQLAAVIGLYEDFIQRIESGLR